MNESDELPEGDVVADSEFAAICESILRDGRITKDEIRDLRRFLRENRDKPVPAALGLAEQFAKAVSDEKVTHGEQAQLLAAIGDALAKTAAGNAPPVATVDVATDDGAMERHKMFLEERKFHLESRAKAIETFDKYMITLASGALALTILYVEKVRQTLPDYSRNWMFATWFCFGATLFVMLLSFLFSSFAWDRRRDMCDKAYCEQTNQVWKEKPPGWSKRTWIQNPYDLFTHGANLAGIGLFTVGVATFLYFAFSSFPSLENSDMAKGQSGGSKPSSSGSTSKPADTGQRGSASTPPAPTAPNGASSNPKSK